MWEKAKFHIFQQALFGTFYSSMNLTLTAAKIAVASLAAKRLKT